MKSELENQRITFLDYDYEGMLPLWLAQSRNEAPPLLLCCFCEESDDPNLYRWNNGLSEYVGLIWYEQWLQQLELLDEFQHGHRYIIARATNAENAWRGLWSRTSYDNHVAHSIFSGDCDPAQLKARVLQNDPRAWFSPDESAEGLCDWFYGQTYGGGSDEHFAYFHARNPQLVEKLRDMIEALPSDSGVRITWPLRE